MARAKCVRKPQTRGIELMTVWDAPVLRQVQFRVLQEPVKLTSDVALQAALDLSVAPALSSPAAKVNLGGLVTSQPGQHDGVQRAVTIAGGD